MNEYLEYEIGNIVVELMCGEIFYEPREYFLL